MKEARRSISLYFSAVLISVSMLTGPSQAEISIMQASESPLGSVFVARITGNITEADYDVLRGRALQAADAEARQIQLDSSGGNLHAALAVGRLIRRLEFDTLVLPGGRCFSACVFVLAAGIEKVVKGDVGIHRPYFSQLGTSEVSSALRSMKSSAIEYLDEMNIPTRLVEDMFSTDPSAMRILSEQELAMYRLNTLDYVVREQRAQNHTSRLGLSREGYEAFLQDLNYRCKVFTGQIDKMHACVRDVAARHGIRL